MLAQQEEGDSSQDAAVDSSPGGVGAFQITEQSTAAKWMQERPYLLIILAIASVVGCCFFSQILLRFSK